MRKQGLRIWSGAVVYHDNADVLLRVGRDLGWMHRLAVDVGGHTDWDCVHECAAVQGAGEEGVSVVGGKD